MRSLRALAPFLFVAGGSFAVTQFITANFIDYRLTDVLASLVSLIASIAFLQVWRPTPDPRFAMKHLDTAQGRLSKISGWQGWLPWALVSVVVIIWTSFKIFAIGEHKIPWPGLDHAVFITLYNKPYAAIWDFQPLATGTAIFLSAVLTAIILRVSLADFLSCFLRTFVQLRFAIITVAFIIALAYVMNYGGMTYTLGKGVASLGGILFPLASAFLGWIAVFLSGSDTSGNALFGNLQVVAANQLGLNPVLFAATNSSGGVMGKMISPQNISTGVSVTDLVGQEGKVFSRTFKHSVFLTLLVGILALLQQYVFPVDDSRPLSHRADDGQGRSTISTLLGMPPTGCLRDQCRRSVPQKRTTQRRMKTLAVRDHRHWQASLARAAGHQRIRRHHLGDLA